MSRICRGLVALVAAAVAWCGVSASSGHASRATGPAAAPVAGEVATVAVTKPQQRGVRPGRWGMVRLRLTNLGDHELTRVRVTGRGTDVFAGTATLREPLAVGESATVRLPVLLTVMAPRRFVVEATASPGPSLPTRKQIVIRPR